jgi:hypothetical protein
MNLTSIVTTIKEVWHGMNGLLPTAGMALVSGTRTILMISIITLFIGVLMPAEMNLCI